MIDPRNHDARIHGLFAQIADDPAPPLGFTADGLAHAGRRGVRARRLAAVGSATAGIAAVGIAVATLPAAGGAKRPAPLASPTTAGRITAAPAPKPPLDPVCQADVAAYAKRFPDPHSKKLALQECPAVRAIDMILDPTGKHLVESDPGGSVITPDIVWGEGGGMDGKAVSTSTDLCYTDKGMASKMTGPLCEETPEVLLQITFALPGAPDPAPVSNDMTLANRKPGVGIGATPWIEKSSSTLSDGSTVTVSEVQNGDRVAMKARRVLKTGASLTVVAQDGYDSTSAVEQPGTVYNPFPFTLAQMEAAASVEYIVAPDVLESFPPLPVGHPHSPPPSSAGH